MTCRWSSRWVEEDPKEILQSVYECMDRTCEKLTQLNVDISNIKGTHVFLHIREREKETFQSLHIVTPVQPSG